MGKWPRYTEMEWACPGREALREAMAEMPGVEFAYLFEMPALGYLGYLPFAMEVYLFASLVLPKRAQAKFG